MNNKHLRIGRVYHIIPVPIPNSIKKEREAVYVGKIIAYGKQRNVFIQMGSTMYYDDSFIEFNLKTKYFWDEMGRKGYFHIAVSKPEHYRQIINVYTKKGKFVELKKNHALELKKLWFQKIEELEEIRWKKAYAFFLLAKELEALKQLNLLKYTMFWKYKNLKPTKVIMKWKNKQPKIY